jgi:hypothetical protein
VSDTCAVRPERALRTDVRHHLDVTRAVEPVEATSTWHAARDLAETFPFGV